MQYDVFVNGMVVVLVVAVVFESISRWRRLVKDEYDRYFLTGFVALILGWLLPIVGDTLTAHMMHGLALICLMMAWSVKRKAGKTTEGTATH